MASIELIQWLQSFETEWLTGIFRMITQLGNESFYIVGLAFLYWCLDRGVAYRLGVLFLFSAWANAGLKMFIHTARPPQSMVQHLVVQTDPAFPSGHAQGTTVFWGSLALTYRQRWLTWLAISVVALVSLSRLYLGVHWPLDLAGGFLIGLLLLGLAALARRVEERTWQAFPWSLRLLLATVGPLALLAIYSGPDAAVTVGALSGMGLGHFLNERFLRSGTSGTLPVQAAKVAGGLVLLLAVRIGLKAVLPEGDTWNLLRYMAIGLSASYLWPWIFTRFAARPLTLSTDRRIQG